MFTHFDLGKTLSTGCLVASVLVCLFVAPGTLEAQTAPNPSTSSGGSTEEGPSAPPPVDEPDEEDVSLTSMPLTADGLEPPSGSTEWASNLFARIFRTWLVGPCGWGLHPLEAADTKRSRRK